MTLVDADKISKEATTPANFSALGARGTNLAPFVICTCLSPAAAPSPSRKHLPSGVSSIPKSAAEIHSHACSANAMAKLSLCAVSEASSAQEGNLWASFGKGEIESFGAAAKAPPSRIVGSSLMRALFSSELSTHWTGDKLGRNHFSMWMFADASRLPTKTFSRTHTLISSQPSDYYISWLDWIWLGQCRHKTPWGNNNNILIETNQVKLRQIPPDVRRLVN